MTESLKTSVRVIGLKQIDEFEALCTLLGRRRHELAADLVLDGIRRYRDDPQTAPTVAKLVAGRKAWRAARDAEQDSTKAARAGRKLIRGEAST